MLILLFFLLLCKILQHVFFTIFQLSALILNYNGQSIGILDG